MPTFQPVAPPLCTRCGFMFRTREGPDHVCGPCLVRPPRIGMARAFGVYDGPLLTAIHRLKYTGDVGLAKPLGDLLLSEFQRWWPSGSVHQIMPAPLHIRRFRKRGYNQAYLLIRDWPRRWVASKMAADAPVIDREALDRRRPTVSQVGMNQEQRTANVHGAFRVRRRDDVRGRRILLIDDVVTTGATADECARVLLDAGAERIDLLTLAQTPLLRARRT